MKKIDENYFKNDKPTTSVEIADLVGEDEQILWQGKPKKSAYIMAAFFKMFPFAMLWLVFDGTFIGVMISQGEQLPPFAVVFMIVFFAFHLIPVWVWLGNVLTASRQYKNIEYAFTGKRIIIKSGVVGVDVKTIYYSQIESVNLKVGLTDKLFKVGDIYITSQNQSQVLFDLTDPYFLSQKLQNIVADIKADIQFPNALRPEENGGYRTKYVQE